MRAAAIRSIQIVCCSCCAIGVELRLGICDDNFAQLHFGPRVALAERRAIQRKARDAFGIGVAMVDDEPFDLLAASLPFEMVIDVLVVLAGAWTAWAREEYLLAVVEKQTKKMLAHELVVQHATTAEKQSDNI